MCGFTGFYQKKLVEGAQTLKSIAAGMNACLIHRGPDHGAVWQDAEVPLVLAHRRLSILDLSSEGNQPMKSASGRYVIVYNGEIYNYRDLQKELEQTGHSFRGRSDTEIFLAGVEQWGLNRVLQKINGMFAIVLWDRKTRELHFIRDPFGKKPLYVGWAGQVLVFASELKAIRRHPDFSGDIDGEARAIYMRFGYVTAPHSIYKNIWMLPPGHRMAIRPETLPAGEDLTGFMDPYWHHGRIIEDARHAMIEKPESEIISEFEHLLSVCVRERMISDVPLGAFLSGGIDSSSIVALMQNASSRPVKTYTVGFSEEDYNEAHHAAAIAAHLGTDHHMLQVSAQDALDVIPSLPDIFDEPFGDISAIPTFLIAKFARGDVSVALSGDGGDEMLGGYNRHVAGARLWNTASIVPISLRKFSAQFLSMLPASLSGMSIAHWQKMITALPAPTQEAMYQSFLTQWNVQAHLSEEAIPRAPSHLNFAEKMMYWDTLSYLPNDILTKLDRASMAVSLECRAPLLDKKIYEYVWRLPEAYKIRDGKGKWLLRQVLQRYVPAELFSRPKQGFSIPVDDWLRGPLKGWADSLLQEMDDFAPGKATLLKAWHSHLKGQEQHGQALWVALMYQAWHKRWA